MMTEVTRDVSNLSSNHFIIRNLDRFEKPNILFATIIFLSYYKIMRD
jgi:hypothetical protein